MLHFSLSMLVLSITKQKNNLLREMSVTVTIFPKYEHLYAHFVDAIEQEWRTEGWSLAQFGDLTQVYSGEL